MATAQFWTILGVIVGLFAIMFTLLLRLEARISSVDTKIDSVETKLDTKIDSVATELRQDIRDQTARIDMLNTAVNQVVKDVGELKGYMVVVSERLNIPKSA
jgi:archaellum component FlaC